MFLSIICFKDSTDSRYACVLLAFDCSGNELYERVIDFIDVVEMRRYELSYVVDNDGHILFYVPKRNSLCVSDNNGKIKTSILLSWHDKDPYIYTFECVTDQNEIVMCSATDFVVLYTTSRKEVLVKNLLHTSPSWTIYIFSKNNEFEYLFLSTGSETNPISLSRHPAGPAELLHSWLSNGKQSAVFMQ